MLRLPPPPRMASTATIVQLGATPEGITEAMHQALAAFQDRLAAGDLLAFELRANPVITSRTPDGKPDKSVLLVGRTREEAESRARDWADGKVG